MGGRERGRNIDVWGRFGFEDMGGGPGTGGGERAAAGRATTTTALKGGATGSGPPSLLVPIAAAGGPSPSHCANGNGEIGGGGASAALLSSLACVSCCRVRPRALLSGRKRRAALAGGSPDGLKKGGAKHISRCFERKCATRGAAGGFVLCVCVHMMHVERHWGRCCGGGWVGGRRQCCRDRSEDAKRTSAGVLWCGVCVCGSQRQEIGALGPPGPPARRRRQQGGGCSTGVVVV